MGLELNRTIVTSEASMKLNGSDITTSYPRQSFDLNNPFNKSRFPKFSNLLKFRKPKGDAILLEVSIMLMMSTLIIIFGGAYAIGKLILMIFHKH